LRAVVTLSTLGNTNYMQPHARSTFFVNAKEMHIKVLAHKNTRWFTPYYNSHSMFL